MSTPSEEARLVIATMIMLTLSMLMGLALALGAYFLAR